MSTPVTGNIANPYVGPRTFAYEDRRFYFGREREARSLLARVVSERLLLFYAQSGAGKSSLINTRIIPGLREEEGFAVLPVGRVGGDLPGGVKVDNIYAFNLMASLDRSGTSPVRLAGLTITEFLAHLVSDDGLAWRYDPAPEAAPGATSPEAPGAGDAPDTPHQRFALVIDQFEEIITSHPNRWEERSAFFRQLDKALQANPDLWVVLTLREDYVAALDPYAPLLFNRLRARFYMERMGLETALDAIRQPAELGNRPFAPDVAEMLRNDLCQVRVAGQEKPVTGQYVEPVQLQVVCYQLWENIKGRPAGPITTQDLTEAGNVNQALSRFYEETLATALADPSAAGVSERQLRAWFDEELITEAGTRGLAHQDETETRGLPNGVVSALQRRFLVRGEARGGDTWIELVHDRFVEPILAANQAWRYRTRPPQIVAFQAEPRVAVLGQEVMLRWQVAEADAVTIEPLKLTVPPAGTLADKPAVTTEYYLSASRGGGQPVISPSEQVRVVDVRRSGPLSGNPYAGARGYAESDRGLFFGRDREAAALLMMTMAYEPVVVLYADAGAGKSSLIQARLVGDLRQQGCQVLPVCRVRPGPAKQALMACLQAARGETDAREARDWQELQAGGRLTDCLAYYFEKTTPPGLSVPTPRVLVIDQLEEIFTLAGEGPEAREAFFLELGEALTDTPGLRVVFGIRAEYFGRLDRYAPLLPGNFRARLYMEPLDFPSALDAVSRPAELAGRSFARGVAETLVAKLCRSAADDSDGTIRAGEFVEPIQLQLVCHRLWESLPREPKPISMEDIGTFSPHTVLTDYYDHILKSVAKQTGIPERRLRVWFDEHLITRDGTLSMAYRGPSETAGLSNEIVDILASAYLIRGVFRAGNLWYEIANDAWLPVIMGSNRTWRATHEASWQRLAGAWEEGNRAPALLLRDAALGDAERRAQDAAADLTPVEQAFLSASRETQRQTELDRFVRAELQTDLEELGWGVVFAPGIGPAVREALAPLLELRRAQATAQQDFYREFSGAGAYRPGDTARAFLARHGAGVERASPDRMPYYLLIVGDPEAIPFEFQYELDAQYAVGRIHFETPDEYASYAHSVVAAERGEVTLPRRAVIFGVQNPDDGATAQVATAFEALAQRTAAAHADWSVSRIVRHAATKECLVDQFRGSEVPALLVTGSWGAMLPSGSPRQTDLQGALVCADWPGPLRGGLAPAHFLAGEEVGDQDRPWGMVVVMFGGYSAGTPRIDEVASWREGSPHVIAPQAFLARLPQRLLAHPGGGALAVIGHVDLIWTTSLDRQGVAPGLDALQKAVGRLMRGSTVGAAAQALNDRYTALSSALAEELQRVMFSEKFKWSEELNRLRVATVDARNFIVIGDPAVRLPVAQSA